jgi:putative intracellular protease/amidase
MIPTSGAILQGTPTGLWLEEFAAPYYMFLEAGYEIVVASSAGGPVPIDTGSMQPGFFTAAAQKLMLDATAFETLSHSIRLDTLSFPGDFDALFIPGGHGAGVDYVNNPTLKAAIESMYEAHKIVATVCHGPMCLIDCVTTTHGTTTTTTPLVAGKRVTGFTNAEEEAVQKTHLVPYLIESKFKEQGALFECAEPWHSHAVMDGTLITGQNPQSSEAVASLVIQALTA